MNSSSELSTEGNEPAADNSDDGRLRRFFPFTAAATPVRVWAGETFASPLFVSTAIMDLREAGLEFSSRSPHDHQQPGCLGTVRCGYGDALRTLSLIHISEPTR